VQHSRIVVWLKYYGPSVIVFVTTALQNLYILYNFLILSLSLFLSPQYLQLGPRAFIRTRSISVMFSLSCTPTHSVFCITLSHSISLTHTNTHTHFLDDIDSDENISRIAKSTNRCFTQCSESSFF